jgi:hypothetical protein
LSGTHLKNDIVNYLGFCRSESTFTPDAAAIGNLSLCNQGPQSFDQKPTFLVGRQPRPRCFWRWRFGFQRKSAGSTVAAGPCQQRPKLQASTRVRWL